MDRETVKFWCAISTALAAAVAAFTYLVNAGPEPTPHEEQKVTDRCERQQLFFQCMAALPAGPASTQYNDWEEVVSACEKFSYRTARTILRKDEPKACNGGPKQ